jgi:hypothetical protein
LRLTSKETIKTMEKTHQLSRLLFYLMFFGIVSCSTTRYEKNKKEYILLLNYVENNYKENVVIYIDVWNEKYYISINSKSRTLLLDDFLKENMMKYKITSISVFPLKEIRLEFKSKPYFEKTKFMVKYLSINPKAKGLQIDDKIFFYRESPNKY